MPTSQDTVYGYQYNYNKSGSEWLLQSKQVSNYIKRERTWPATLSRIIPQGKVALFRAGTARSVSTIIRNDSRFDYSYFSESSKVEGARVLDIWPPTSTSGLYQRVSGGAGINPMSPPTVLIDREFMYNDIRNKIRGDAANLGNMLGEYRQTAELFHDLAKIVSSRGASLIKRHPRLAKRGQRPIDLGKSAADAHLQFVYGIKPLMQDLGTSVGEIVSRIQRPVVLMGSVQRRLRNRSVGYHIVTNASTPFVCKVDFDIQQFKRTKYAAYMRTNDIATTLAQHGMLNPLSVAWEVTPYSFIIDWWANVGDVLASLDNLVMFSSLWVVNSTSTRTSRYYNTVPSAYPGTKFTKPGSAFYCERVDDRFVPAEISLLVTPKLKLSASAQHFANGLALLTSRRVRG